MTRDQYPRVEALNSLQCDLASEVLCSTGFLRFRAMGWSMVPSIHPGDICLIQRAEISEISLGDIVLFSRERRLFLHRVTRKIDASADLMLITRGDSMSHDDEPITNFELLGKLACLRRVDRWINPAKTLTRLQRVAANAASRFHGMARIIVALPIRQFHERITTCPH